MYRQQAALRHQRAKPVPIQELPEVPEELPEEVPEEVPEAEAAAADNEAVQPLWQEEADYNTLFYQVQAVLLDSELFARYCVVEGHSDMQQGERRSTMDQREFITMLQSLGVMEDSPVAPTHKALLKSMRKLSKGAAASIFRDASGAAKQRKAASEQASRTGRRGSQMRVSELNFSSFCKTGSPKEPWPRKCCMHRR